MGGSSFSALFWIVARWLLSWRRNKFEGYDNFTSIVRRNHGKFIHKIFSLFEPWKQNIRKLVYLACEMGNNVRNVRTLWYIHNKKNKSNSYYITYHANMCMCMKMRERFGQIYTHESVSFSTKETVYNREWKLYFKKNQTARGYKSEKVYTFSCYLIVSLSIELLILNLRLWNTFFLLKVK